MAFVQSLGENQSKTDETSIILTVASLTVTVDNNIFVSFGSDDIGSGFSCVDNLGNTYTLVEEVINSGNCKVQLWRALITVGGTLTSITMSWTTNITAKCIIAGEFGPVGPIIHKKLYTGNNSLIESLQETYYQSGMLYIVCAAVENDKLVVYSGIENAGNVGSTDSIKTTGGGATTNIGLGQGYISVVNSKGTNLQVRANVELGTAVDFASIGITYSQVGSIAWKVA
jgi:hypothetical protein